MTKRRTRDLSSCRSFHDAACCANSLASLEAFAAGRSDIGAVDKKGRNALHHIAEHPSPGVSTRTRREIIEFLIRNGCDPLQKDASGRTPFVVAILEADTQLVEVLCSLGCDPNAPCEVRKADSQLCEPFTSPAVFVLIYGDGAGHDAKMTRALLLAGADVEAKGPEGFNVLESEVSWSMQVEPASEIGQRVLTALRDEACSADVTTKSHAKFLDVVSRRAFERLMQDFPKLNRLHAERGIVPPMTMLAAGEHWARRQQKKTPARR